MLEKNIPDINVDELMEKIRAEVRLRRERDGTLHRTVPHANAAPPSSLYARIDPSKIQAIPDPEPFEYKEQGYHINDFLKYHDQQFVTNAYRGILRRGPDSEAFEYFLKNLRSGKMTKAEVLGRLRYAPEGRLKRVKVSGLSWTFAVQSSFRIPVLGYLFRLGVGIVNLPTILRNFSHLDATISAQLSDQRDRFNVTVRMSQSKVNEMIDAIEVLQGILDQKTDMEELVALGKEKADEQELLALKEQKADREEVLSLREEKADKAGVEMSLNQKADKEDIGQIHEQIQDILRRMRDYKSTIVDQQQRLGLLLEEVPERISEPFYKEQWKAITQEESRWLDYFFATFQDTFRGTREEVRSRLKMYPSLIQEAKAGTQRRPVLDLGCGRGEWIEILQEEGLFVRGVDNNRVLFEQCLERGMDVVDSDAIEYLQALPAASLGAITAFHLIEHLSFEAMVDLFDEAIRVLRSDGVVIFETPNIRNILVGASDFYRDPSHHRPIFPDTLQFLAQERGLVNTNCYFIQETESGPELIPSEEKQFDILEDYLEVSRDYVFVGYKS